MDADGYTARGVKGEVYQSGCKIDRIARRNLESKYSQQELRRRASFSLRGQPEGTMPLYEYSCTACAHRFERIVKFSDAPLTICPECGRETIEQVISAPAVQFKGSGWYVTDYARKSSPGSSSSPSSNKAESSSESGASASRDSGSSDSSSSSSSASSDQSASNSGSSANSSSTNNASSGDSSSGGAKNSSAKENK
jgi:putative FmdB family regulatory protein